MVLISWEQWESLKNLQKVGRQVDASLEKFDVGVQTKCDKESYDCFQESGAIGKNKNLDEGRGAGGAFLSSLPLPSPPAEFVKTYFEGADTFETNFEKKKNNKQTGKIKLRGGGKRDKMMKRKKQEVDYLESYKSEWVNLK